MPASSIAAARNIPTQSYDSASLNRSSFPAGFVFGTASAAYQVSHLSCDQLDGTYKFNPVTHYHIPYIVFNKYYFMDLAIILI